MQKYTRMLSRTYVCLHALGLLRRWRTGLEMHMLSMIDLPWNVKRPASVDASGVQGYAEPRCR